LKILKQYQDEAGQNAMALRQATFIASLHMTAMLAEKALGLSIPYEVHLREIFKRSMAELSEANKAKEAHELLMSLEASRKKSFWSPGNKNQPMGGWLGVLNPDGKKDLIAFIPHRLESCLKERHYDVRSILRIWKEERLLKIDGNNLKCKVTLDGDRPRLYVLRREEFLKKKMLQPKRISWQEAHQKKEEEHTGLE